MSIIREFFVRFRIQIFLMFVAATSLLGAFFALATVDRYQAVVKGILGLTVLYEFYREFQSITRKPNEPVGLYLELPRDLKYIAYGFFITAIGVWAGSQILPAIWFLQNLFKR